MSAPRKLYDALAAVAQQQSICVAVIAEGRNLTYGALMTAVDNCAAAMTARGIGEGHVIVLNFARPELYILCLFAASRVGASPVFANFADAGKLLQPADFRLVDDRVPPAERAGALIVDASWLAAPPSAFRVPDSTFEGQLLFGTSGSTGERKFVALNESAVIMRLPSRRAYINSETRLFSALGARTAVTTESRVATLLSGGSIAILPNTMDIPHYIDLFGVNTMMSAPMTLADLLNLKLPKRIYSSLRKLTVGGAAPSPALLDAVADAMCADITIGYGNTELGSVTHYSYVKSDYRPGKVGKVLPGMEVSIVDEAGVAVSPGSIGQVRIRPSERVSEMAYASVGSPSAGFVDGWFLPGDRGWFDEQGNLNIAGRDDDVINASGNKYNVDLIESEIEARLDCRCVVLRSEKTEHSERVTILVAAARQLSGEAIARFVESRFPRLGILAVFAMQTMQTTESGKKDRVAAARLLQESPGLFARLWPAGAAAQRVP